MDECVFLLSAYALPSELCDIIVANLASGIYFHESVPHRFYVTSPSGAWKIFKRTIYIEGECQCDRVCAQIIRSILDNLIIRLKSVPLLAAKLEESFRLWCINTLPPRHQVRVLMLGSSDIPASSDSDSDFDVWAADL